MSKRNPKLSAKVKDTNNLGDLQLRSHQEAHNQAVAIANLTSVMPSSNDTLSKRKQPLRLFQLVRQKLRGTSLLRPQILVVSLLNAHLIPNHSNFSSLVGTSTSKKKSIQVQVESSSSDSEEESEEETPKLTMKQHAQDVNAFFDAAVKVPGSTQPKRQCLLCK